MTFLKVILSAFNDRKYWVNILSISIVQKPIWLLNWMVPNTTNHRNNKKMRNAQFFFSNMD